jgi:hypothetical protein
MIWLLKRLQRLNHDRRAARLKAERAVALAAFHDAIHARDTRRQHATWPEAHRATNAALRAGV